ncbi:MAG: aldehyde dehydrogenase [Flavobacteriaceae bacterium]|nr:aldehyde dehydrogenase [Flavobacteriaceae bacterium]
MNISEILNKQSQFFDSEKTRNSSYLKALLKALRDEIVNREEDIYNALYKDFKKSKFETFLSEIGIVLSELDLAIKHIHKWSKPKRVKPSMLNFPSTDYIYSEPYGTVLIIGPWNYPFQLALAPAIAAITAGNTVVIKPSELTPNTSKLVEEILIKVFQKEHITVVQGGVQETTELLAQKWDYIFFTGSVPVGKIVAKAAAQHMTPVTLELGGKNPCIIDETVNLKLVARRLVWGKFVNAGQTCIAPDYLLVKTEIKTSLINHLIKEIENAYTENPEDSSDYPRIINSKNLERLTRMLSDSKIAYGGNINKADNYLSPTLIDEPSLDSDVMKDEIFGPILPILTYSNEADLKTIISCYEKPLAFYVFSKNKRFAKKLMSQYCFGGGTINDTMIHFGNHRLPFGGVGESGIGAYHGRLGFDTFTHQKAVIIKGNWLDIPMRYAPYKNKITQLKSMFKWLS